MAKARTLLLWTLFSVALILIGVSVVETVSEVKIIPAQFSRPTRDVINWASDVIERVFQLLGFQTFSWWVLIKAGLATAAAVYGYELLFKPMNRVRYLGQVGYICDPGVRSTEEMVKVVQRRRMVGQVPPVYPNGWFAVIESRDLAKGEVKGASCCGKNLAVFRGEDGRAQILDAYCAHMGANLAAGGLVKGNCLECPFHGWRFRGDDGKCVHIPYCEDKKHIPDSAKVESYIVLERNGFIHMWFHAEGNDPHWFPPEIPEITSGEWTYRGRMEHIISAHIEEIPENGADVAHLQQLHSPFMGAGIDLRTTHTPWWSFAKHNWEGNWEPDAEEKHIGVLTLKHGISLFGKNTFIFNMEVKARQIGPGLVYLTFSSPFGSAAYLQSVTPVEPLVQRMINQIYFSKGTPTCIAKFFLLGEALQVERDLMIWNNKTYQSKPVFVKSREDTLVARHRRWYSQFYTEHSPRLRTESPLEW